MFLLRRLLYETSAAGQIHLMSDISVLECVRQMLRSGELKVGELIVAKDRETAGALSSAGPAPSTSRSDPPPSPTPAPRQSRAERAPDPDTFDSSLDGVMQAGVLTAAAASGAAFCET